ncbi:UDP-N-acetylmuramoyl-tripeptide--D-alanyl-D-alanine ligase [Biformimicrobium ophioploci]|uniref:UDP-N-acetylmuramoyl-tripeptide--D-alanyl-D-alanine ligase n=1 Tax=Biformimicrobium ophioploci TaxID=3036711 RepID=A0ABQ6LX46_9GAMM|nr:UDP-N-acetylmuramoyl-tripeptide--D-alanyl-D-alanine ligase [Microbulbifer sp. NKW57]GMG86644.1 UDP-N-acetylmuramoyl-tripeptide--D-alanyl-D-alanine ligase [Microbulbifer sp. NKW57]
MIEALSLQQLQQRFGGELHNGDACFTGVGTDSRNVAEGDLFVALSGENFDAHDFVASVADKVCGVIVSRHLPDVNVPQWQVDDTVIALGQVAMLCREKFSGKVIGITGSCGKTTVKEMLAAVLQQKHNVCVTRGNLNNHIGVPLTLFGLGHEHEVAIIEMGASGPSEIGYLCSLARPQVTGITNVQPAHVEGFGSIQGIANAKGQIYSGLEQNGVAVVNVDDDFAPQWLNAMRSDIATTRVSVEQAADIFATDASVNDAGFASFTLHIGDKALPVNLKVLGGHNVANAVMVAGLARGVGLEAEEIVAGIEQFTGVAGRMAESEGHGASRVIDDSYNANPGSVTAAIKMLATRAGKRVLVLGDMKELGEDALEQHRNMGRLARQSGIDALYTIGELASAASESFGADGRHYPDRQALVRELSAQLDEHTTVLVKGSRSARMELIVQALTQEEG